MAFLNLENSALVLSLKALSESEHMLVEQVRDLIPQDLLFLISGESFSQRS